MQFTPQIHLSDLSIRTDLRPGDLGYIAYIHGLQYAKELGYGLGFESYVLMGLAEFARRYDPKKDRIWICEHDEKIIGFLIAVYGDGLVQFRYFIFLPQYRGIGLGKKLMDGFMAYMKESGHKRAFLWTTNEQQAAIALYTRYGFRLTEQKISQAFDKPLTELRFDLNL